MNIEFLATVAVIAPDPPASRKLFVDALGLPPHAGRRLAAWNAGQRRLSPTGAGAAPVVSAPNAAPQSGAARID